MPVRGATFPWHDPKVFQHRLYVPGSSSITWLALRACALVFEVVGVAGYRRRRPGIATVVAGPETVVVSPSRSRVYDLVVMIEDLFGLPYSWEGVRKMLHRLGLVWRSPSPLHPKAALEAQEAFRRDFPARVRRKVGPKGAVTTLEFWFQDEARRGQMGI